MEKQMWNALLLDGCDSLYSQQPLKSVGKADFLRIKDLCEESIQVLGKSMFVFSKKVSAHPSQDLLLFKSPMYAK
jgi:hypothetical protein